jgi:hypothetical protein
MVVVGKECGAKTGRGFLLAELAAVSQPPTVSAQSVQCSAAQCSAPLGFGREAKQERLT